LILLVVLLYLSRIGGKRTEEEKKKRKRTAGGAHEVFCFSKHNLIKKHKVIISFGLSTQIRVVYHKRLYI